jgi:hypothetical protein
VANGPKSLAFHPPVWVAAWLVCSVEAARFVLSGAGLGHGPKERGFSDFSINSRMPGIMDAVLPKLPREYLGPIYVRQRRFFGLLPWRKKLLLELERGRLQWDASDCAVFEGQLNVVTHPPTLYVALSGTGRVNLQSNEFEFLTEEHDLRLNGTISPDRQLIEARIEFLDFGLDSVRGEFYDQAIVLETGERTRRRFETEEQIPTRRGGDPVAALAALGAEFERDPNNAIIGLDLNAVRADIRSADLRHISQFRDLRRLSVSCPDVSEESLGHLSELSELEEFDLQILQLTALGMSYLTSLPKLRDLSLSDAELTREAVELISSMSSLRRLVLEGCAVDDVDFHELCRLTQLKELHITAAEVSDAGLGPLADLTGLRSLTLVTLDIGGEGLRHVSSLKQMETLSIQYTQISDDDLIHLAGLTSLRRLYLGNNEIVGTGLKHLTSLAKLESLGLVSTYLDQEGAPHLREFPQLQELDVSYTPLSDGDVEHIASLRNLRRLRIQPSDVSESGIERLKHALPQCEIT